MIKGRKRQLRPCLFLASTTKSVLVGFGTRDFNTRAICGKGNPTPNPPGITGHFLMLLTKMLLQLLTNFVR